jgi:molybdopterin-guanine dinucleotide biosynthesis protein A
MSPPLFGLVLAGGASTRMRTDKAALQYHGQPQLQWAFELVSKFCAASFVSVRPDQRDDTARAAHPQIVDRQPGIGPIAGISAALLEQPKAAWLVLACDLPFLTERTLEHLIAHRDASKIATAYRSAHDGLPEPLCAIWEPAAREPVLAYIASGKQCPRKLLINSDTKLLDLPERQALDNVNTTEEFGLATAALQSALPSPPPRSGGGTRTVRIQYYAILREQAGRSEETLDTSAGTPTELYAELRQRHPFQLAPAQLKVALNSEFSDWQTPLKHGDTVVFIPPVAGG